MIDIFPSLYEFTYRINSFGISPHVNENNKILFNYILDKDISAILKFKNISIDISRKKKLKNIFKCTIKKFLR